MSASADELPSRAGEVMMNRLREVAGKHDGRLDRATEEALLEQEEGDFRAVARNAELELREARWRRTIPAMFHGATLDTIEGEVRVKLEAWATGRGPKPNLVLFGPVGSGKSHAAVAAVKPAFMAGLDVRFMPTVEMLDLLRPGGPERALYDLADIDRLVLDDVGSERATDWTLERVYALINRRWLDKVPTVATTNLDPKRLEECLEARAFSRLMHNAVVIRLGGRDRRLARG